MSKEITWINCAERMPPDDTDIICPNVMDGSWYLHIKSSALAKVEKVRDISSVTWTEFTREKWEYLNK